MDAPLQVQARLAELRHQQQEVEGLQAELLRQQAQLEERTREVQGQVSGGAEGQVRGSAGAARCVAQGLRGRCVAEVGQRVV